MSVESGSIDVEEWRVVPGWSAYAVSSLGKVKRIRLPKQGRAKVGHILKGRIPSKNSYPAVVLSSDEGKTQQWFIHRIVMHAFVGPCPPGQEVNHINGDKNDSRLENLEYVTRSQNMIHAFNTGLKSAKGIKNARAILSNEDIKSILSEYTGKFGQCAELAKRYGVSHASMQDIVHGRSWTHVDGDRSVSAKENRQSRKIQRLEQVLSDRRSGITLVALGEKMGITHTAIMTIEKQAIKAILNGDLGHLGPLTDREIKIALRCGL